MPSKAISGDHSSKPANKPRKKKNGKETKKYCFNEKDAIKIIEYLQKNPSPQRTLTLARYCHHSTAKPINPTLYALKKSGQLKHIETQPPSWALPNYINDTEPPKISVNTTQKEMIHAQQSFGVGRGILSIPQFYENRTEFGGGRGGRRHAAEESGRKMRGWSGRSEEQHNGYGIARGRGGGFKPGHLYGRHSERPILGRDHFGVSTLNHDNNVSRFADSCNHNYFFPPGDQNEQLGHVSLRGDSFLDETRSSDFDSRCKRGKATEQTTSVQWAYNRRDEYSTFTPKTRTGSQDQYSRAKKPVSGCGRVAGQDSLFRHTSSDQSAPGAYRSSHSNYEQRGSADQGNQTSSQQVVLPLPENTLERPAPGAYKRKEQKMEHQENKEKTLQESNFPPALAALMPSGHPVSPTLSQNEMNSYGPEVNPASDNFVELENSLLSVLASSSKETLDFHTLMTLLGISRPTLEDVLAECQQEDLLEVNSPNEVRLTSKGMRQNSSLRSGDEDVCNDSDFEDWDGTLHSAKSGEIGKSTGINNEDDLSVRIQDVCNLIDVNEFNLISGLEYESITDDSEDWSEAVSGLALEVNGVEENLKTRSANEGVGLDERGENEFGYSCGDIVGEELELQLLRTLSASHGETVAIKHLKEILAVPWSTLEDVLAEGQQEELLLVQSPDQVMLTGKGQNYLQNLDQSKISGTGKVNVDGPPLFPAEIVRDKALSREGSLNVDTPPLTPAQIIHSRSVLNSNVRNDTDADSNVTKTLTSDHDKNSALNLKLSTKCSSLQLPPSCVPVPNPGLKSSSEPKFQTLNNSDVRATKALETSRAVLDRSDLNMNVDRQKMRNSLRDIPGREHLVQTNRENVQNQVGAFRNSFPSGLPLGTSSGKRPPLLSAPNSVNLNPPGFLNRSSAEKIPPLLPNPYSKEAWLSREPTVPYQLSGGEATPRKLEITSESFAALNKNPISALMEYAQSRQISARIVVLSQSGPPHKPTFLVAAVVGKRQFPGVSHSNKKDGRKDAAEQAIRILIAEGQYHLPSQVGLLRLPESQMTLFDKMAALTHHRFNSLIASIPETLTGRKVIAGMVMKVDEMDKGTVIAIGSGNRCVTGDKLSLHGHTVNDCHAEIITRRGFLRFLYSQLQTYKENQNHPLFEPSAMTGKLKLKDSVSFHLYISTAPCGDGALFSPRDVKSNNGPASEEYRRHRPTMGGQSQGLLRTKMEGGEGTIPVNHSDGCQTWDGILRGERLRTMSCSDKICRWNVVGMQGALLSHFLDPVYMGSLSLGYLYDQGHLSRAVCCRLDRGDPALEDDLPSSYRLHHPLLGRVTACDPPRETQKTKSYSVNWAYGDEKPEVLEGSTGRLPSGESSRSESRLCKSELYNMFKTTCQRLGKEKLIQNPNYLQAKRRSQNFLFAKLAMCEKFEELNYGKWVFKPEEEKVFSWCLSSSTETKEEVSYGEKIR